MVYLLIVSWGSWASFYQSIVFRKKVITNTKKKYAVPISCFKSTNEMTRKEAECSTCSAYTIKNISAIYFLQIFFI